MASGVGRGRLQEVSIARRDNCCRWGFHYRLWGSTEVGLDSLVGGAIPSGWSAIYWWLLGVSIEGVGGYGGVIVSGEVLGD